MTDETEIMTNVINLAPYIELLEKTQDIEEALKGIEEHFHPKATSLD